MPNDDTFKMVKRALDSGRPANAYLIVGPVRGIAMDRRCAFAGAVLPIGREAVRDLRRMQAGRRTERAGYPLDFPREKIADHWHRARFVKI